MNFLDRTPFRLNPPNPGNNDQCLAQRMRVPRGSRARFKCHERRRGTPVLIRLK